MEKISTNCKKSLSDILNIMAKKRNLVVRMDIKEFLEKNSGGYPIKDIVNFDGEEYEIRVFLSLDSSDVDYYIEKPLVFFLDKTKNKIMPIGIDSGDNYYCVNNDSGKVYYWSASEDQFFCIAKSLDEFVKAFV